MRVILSIIISIFSSTEFSNYRHVKKPITAHDSFCAPSFFLTEITFSEGA